LAKSARFLDGFGYDCNDIKVTIMRFQVTTRFIIMTVEKSLFVRWLRNVFRAIFGYRWSKLKRCLQLIIKFMYKVHAKFTPINKLDRPKYLHILLTRAILRGLDALIPVLSIRRGGPYPQGGNLCPTWMYRTCFFCGKRVYFSHN
jgi:hypothetical protein